MFHAPQSLPTATNLGRSEAGRLKGGKQGPGALEKGTAEYGLQQGAKFVPTGASLTTCWGACMVLSEAVDMAPPFSQR